jgi:hypothetical protein
VSFEEIVDIGQRRQLGEYAGAHFTMTPFAFDCLRALAPPPPTVGWEGAQRLTLAGAAGDLIGIPLMLDPDLPDDEWRLVDSQTGEVLRVGSFPMAPPAEPG